MSREGTFLVYCIEIYKSSKQISGKKAIEIFRQYGIIEYVCKYFEALHTTGENYIVNDIDQYIQSQQISVNS